jgi:dTDP-4-amino-4,6-dideoxygalactose transaminase
MKQIPLFKVFMSPNAGDEVTKVLNSGYIGQGEKVEEFESTLSDYFMRDYVVTLNSGTSGLHLALHLLKKQSGKWPGLEDGDEVLATPLTCTASNFPIMANGLNIKWVDIDPETLNMDLDDLSRKISPKTKVIMLVHWGGYPNDLDKIKQIQTKCFDMYGFKPAIIEDGAHSFGSKYKGKLLGNHGNIVMYSLQAIKHITSIDGGLLVLPHRELYDRSKLLRWYGIDRNSNRKDFRCEADIEEWGFKFHMNDVNASIGLANLKETQKNVTTVLMKKIF